MLDIIVENHPEGRVRVILKGRLDTQTYTQCEEKLTPVLVPATKLLVFDMAGLDYLSSMGLRVLMKANRVLAAQGSKCLLTRLQPSIRRVIEIANALPKEAVFASVEEADAYLDAMQKQTQQDTPKTYNL